MIGIPLPKECLFGRGMPTLLAMGVDVAPLVWSGRQATDYASISSTKKGVHTLVP